MRLLLLSFVLALPASLEDIETDPRVAEIARTLDSR
jgi:hypothetical protein